MPGRRQLRRPLAVALAGAVLAPSLLLGPNVAASLARFVDADATTHSITSDTLDPPTALAATGSASVALTWTATVDTYAAGYDVQRGTVSGGPYTTVSSVTPRTTVATTNTPATSGTYYYILRSTFQNWISLPSNQVSATVTVGPTATGFKGCTAASNAIDTGGDGNGYESNPGNACGDDLLSATDASSGTNTTVNCTNAGKDRHRFWDFGLGIPAVVSSVGGIQVRTDVGLNNNGGTTQICAQLSWDGGTNWTTAKSVALSANAITTYTLGATNDLWGRAWTGAQFSNANFRVRLIDVSSQPNKSFTLEYVAVQVTYTP